MSDLAELVRPNILIVDDRPDRILALEAVLSPLKPNVFQACSGPDALKLLEETKDFAVILLDVNMPLMDGFETASCIRKNPGLRDIPIIFVSALEADDDRLQRGYSLGAVDYIPTPASPGVLRAKVSVFIDLYRKTKELKEATRALQLEVKERNERLRDSEEEIKKLNAELESHVTERTAGLKETNEQLENFCYTVSHDLRAPLRAMRGFSQALNEEYKDQLDDLARDYLQRIINSASRMDSLIQDLMIYSRASRRELKLEEVDLAEVIDSAQSTLEEEMMKKHGSLVVHKPLPRVMAHREALEQAMTNLILNSLTYVKEGVRPQIEIKAQTQGPVVRLEVEDNGIGIAAEHHERIFRIFERLHFDQYPGTGVGLAIVRRTVERMGGKVGLNSSINQGSRFWIELPAAGRAEEQ